MRDSVSKTKVERDEGKRPSIDLWPAHMHSHIHVHTCKQHTHREEEDIEQHTSWALKP